MEKFDYQGKRKDQVESSYKIFFYSSVAMIVLGCAYFIYELIKML